jgi:protein SCO1/2
MRDKVWVASFLFTSCESMCPMIAKKMQSLQEKFHQHPDFRQLSFSLDPQNDTPLKLKAYAQKYQADTAQWQFLTGSWTEIRTLMVDGFRVIAPEQPASHTDRLILVDRGMKIFGYYSANSAEDMEKLQSDITKLLE